MSDQEKKIYVKNPEEEKKYRARMSEYEKKDELWQKIDKSKWVKTGFVKLDNRLLRRILLTTGAPGLATYIILLSHRNTETNVCNPSLATIGEELGGKARGTVSRNISELADAGFIKIESGSQHVSNYYYFPQEDFYENEEGDIERRSGTSHKYSKSDVKINELTENERSTFKKQEKVSETKFIKAAAKATTPAIESKTTAPAPVASARVNPEDACDAFDTTDAITANTITASQIAGDDVDF